MEYALLVARSLTRAQRMLRQLQNSGIRAELRKAPAGLTNQGCSYVLQLRPQQLEEALQILRQADLAPLSVWVREENRYREWRQ